MLDRKKHIVLKASNLVIGYSSKKQQQVIASNINIELEKGKLVCLLGKNGIGKSTLLRTLSKVQSKLGGDLHIDQTSIDDITSRELSKKMSLVLTERIPQSNLTVYELIALGRQPYTNWIGTISLEDKKKIHKAIELVRIEDLIHQKCDELSDGQLQKVMIARSLAQDTQLIILDEPTAHLDIHHKMEVFNLLRTLVQELKKTVIISTHEIQLALQLADKLWLLKDTGFTDGSTNELIENGHLDRLFSNEFVKFNIKTKQFIINKP